MAQHQSLPEDIRLLREIRHLNEQTKLAAQRTRNYVGWLLAIAVIGIIASAVIGIIMAVQLAKAGDTSGLTI